VAVVLVTGMSGTGKSAALAELARRGYRVVDTDYGGYSEEVPSSGPGGFEQVWREAKIEALLDGHDDGVLFVSGCVSNQGKFYPRFDAVVLLSAPDKAAGEGEEGFVDVVAAVGADQESATVVQPGEGALDDPALLSEAGAVLGLAARDDRLDAALPDKAAVLVVVVAAVGDQRPRTASRTTDPATHGRHPIQQRDQLGDIAAVAAGERPGERHAAAVYE
jgi:NAD(P)-dependent dehydrogenase (short-subunit alcohol dehydrogenase family)